MIVRAEVEPSVDAKARELLRMPGREASMTASPEKLHELLMHCIDFGEVMLADSGEFHPFGATLGLDGAVAAVGGYNGEEHPAAQEIYQLLSGAFTSSANEGSIAAAALAVNVNIPAQFDPPAPDGIRVLIESGDVARFIYIPYVVEPRRSGGGYSVTLLEPFSVEARPRIFASVARIP